MTVLNNANGQSPLERHTLLNGVLRLQLDDNLIGIYVSLLIPIAKVSKLFGCLKEGTFFKSAVNQALSHPSDLLLSADHPTVERESVIIGVLVAITVLLLSISVYLFSPIVSSAEAAAN